MQTNSNEKTNPDSVSPSFPAGTFITTDKGLVRIEDIQIGDLVLTHNRRYRPVTSIGSKIAETIILKGQGHHGLVAAAENKFHVRKRDHRKKAISDPFAREAVNLQGNHWASVSHFPASEIPPIILTGNESVLPKLNKSLFWLIGAYLGDGWPSIRNGSGALVFGVNKAKSIRIKRRLRTLGLTATVTEQRTSIRLTVYGRALANWVVAHFGHGSGGKRIPMWVLGMPKEFRKALMDGYIAMDGTPMTNDMGHRVVTISRELAFGFKMLANSLGYASSVEYHPLRRAECFIEGRKVNEQPYYRVSASRSKTTSFEMDGHRFGVVRSVSLGETMTVFSLEVQEDNSYVADGIVVENPRPLERCRADMTSLLSSLQNVA